MGIPQSIQVMDEHFSIESHGFLSYDAMLDGV